MNEAQTTKGVITLGKNTKDHAKWLADRNYEVKINIDEIVVNVSKFVNETIVVKTEEELGVFLKGVVDRKEALTYTTYVVVGGGVPIKGFVLCNKLGAASALVMKPQDKIKPKANKFNLGL